MADEHKEEEQGEQKIPTTPPEKPQKPSATPTATAEKPNTISPEDLQEGIKLAQEFNSKQQELGKKERAWHISAVEFYKAEAKIAQFDKAIREKYDIGPEDRFDFNTGRIIRR